MSKIESYSWFARRLGWLKWGIIQSTNGGQIDQLLPYRFLTWRRAQAFANTIWGAYNDGSHHHMLRQLYYENKNKEAAAEQDKTMAEPWIKQIVPIHVQIVEEAGDEGAPLVMLRASLARSGDEPAKCIDIVVAPNQCLRLAQELLKKVHPR